MCNACAFFCCGSDLSEACGCSGCPYPACRDDEPDDDDGDDGPFPVHDYGEPARVEEAPLLASGFWLLTSGAPAARGRFRCTEGAPA